MSGSYVLLVEDDPGDARLAMSVLQKLQLKDRAIVVNDSEEALDCLNARGKFQQRSGGLPAVIVLDLKLPRVTGFELLEQIKADPRLRLIPIVVLTSSNQPSDIEKAYGLGVNGYVVKNIDYKLYVVTLRAVLQYWLMANEPPYPVTECRLVRTSNAIRSPARLSLLNLWLAAYRRSDCPEPVFNRAAKLFAT